MKCNEIRELMPDLAAGLGEVTPEVKEHVNTCVECAGKLEAFRQTMTLLDEWQAPEPSPYFDVRLKARLREEAARPARTWLHWLRRPALAVSLALAMVVGVTLIQRGGLRPTEPKVAQGPEPGSVVPGTAVGDLQALDKNHDIYADFDLLDDLQVQQDVNANP
jgi:predicted anti-sigma-YlaC factor YlaD